MRNIVAILSAACMLDAAAETGSSVAITAPQVLLWDRATMKSEESSQPPYSESQITARKTLTEELTEVLQRHIGEAGGYITLNQKGNRELLALTIPIGEIAVTHPVTGKVLRARESNINLNMPVRTEEVRAAETPMTAPASPEEIYKAMLARRQAANKR